ncbi:hypothetical protein K8R62_04445 [bacterium]|nr:hypothetical protein [bacterium]
MKNIGELERKLKELEERFEMLSSAFPLNLEDRFEVFSLQMQLLEKKMVLHPKDKKSLLSLPFREAARFIGIPMRIVKHLGVKITFDQVVKDAKEGKLQYYRMIGPKSAKVITYYLKIAGFI